jgi:myo-inositol catabolism protein IolH
VKLAVDPYMLRKTPLLELPAVVAELGHQFIELSPREDFLPFFVHPRADRPGVAAFRKELAGAGVELASVLPLYRWSGPEEDVRQAAVRYWRRAIQITVDLGCDVMNSEFNGRPEQAAASEAQFWRSMEELLPVFEREGVRLVLEPHPDDFMEDGRGAGFDGIATVCVFAWEERARESLRGNRDKVREYLARHGMVAA